MSLLGLSRPLRSYNVSNRVSGLLSHLDNPVEIYLRTLFIYDTNNDAGMEYQSLTPRDEERAETESTRLTDIQEDYNSNTIIATRSNRVSTVSVKSWRPHGSLYMSGRRGGIEHGWSFLPRTMQKWQIYVCRHLMVIWDLFTDNFKDKPIGHRQSVIIEGCCDCALCRCLRRVPYGTLFATLLVAGGLALLCYETLTVRNAVTDMFKGTALDPETSKEPFSMMFDEGHAISFWVLIAVVSVMGLFVLLLLVFACFSTGSSGKNTCGKQSARCVGRFSTCLMIMATYFVSLIWLITIVVLSMAFTFMLMLRAFCNGSVPENPPDTTCIDLSHYGLVNRGTEPGSSAANTTICGDNLQTFCDKNEDIHLCVYLIMVACVVIVIGMVHFLMSLAANHTYLKVFQSSDPPRSKFGTDYRRTYNGNDYPGLQEPLNMSDETTRF